MAGREPFRIVPNFPVTAYQTFAVHAPLSTHWRSASCTEVNCWAYHNGWKTKVDERTTTGQGQAHYIRKDSGRRFTEHREPDGTTVFTFEAGQVCFGASQHRVRLDKQEIYIVRPGDWRGNPEGPNGVRRHTRAIDWVEHFAEHQESLAQRVKEG